MKRIFTLAAMYAALPAMLASCNKDGADNDAGAPESDRQRTIALSMVYPEAEGTRAAGTPVTASDYIYFTTGHIFFVNNATPDNYATTDTTQYTTGGNAVGLADYIDQPSTSGSLAYAGGDVWAYNVFGSTTAGNVPHIVIKFSSVTYTTSDDPTNPVTVTTPQFVTITSFLDSGNKVDPIVNGSVYSFSDLSFNYSNLSDMPEPETTYAVQAAAVVKPWAVVGVTSEY